MSKTNYTDGFIDASKAELDRLKKFKESLWLAKDNGIPQSFEWITLDRMIVKCEWAISDIEKCLPVQGTTTHGDDELSIETLMSLSLDPPKLGEL